MQGAELLRALVGGAYPAREQDHRVGERGLPPGLTFEDMAGGLVTFSIRKWIECTWLARGLLTLVLGPPGRSDGPMGQI